MVAEGFRQLGPRAQRAVDVPLHLGERDGCVRERPRGEGDPVEGVLPPLVHQSVRRGALVLDEAVAVPVAVGSHPVERAIDVGQQRFEVGQRGAPPSQLAHEHDEERRRVGRAVVDGVGAGHPGGRQTGADLVEDAPGLLLGRRVDARGPDGSASTWRVPRATRASRGSSIQLVSSESRPKTVMNHGAPAARMTRSSLAGSVMRSPASSSVHVRSSSSNLGSDERNRGLRARH